MLPSPSPGAISRRVARIHAPLALKLQGAFFLIIVILLVTGLISLLVIRRMERQAVELDNLNKAVTLSQAGLDHSIVAQEHLSSMFVLTGDEAYHAKLIIEQRRFREALTQLQSYQPGAAELDRLNETFTRYERASEMTVETKKRGDHQLAQEIHVAQEHVIAHEIEALTRSLVGRVQAARQAGLTQILKEQRQATWIIGGLFLLAIGLAVSLGALLARSIVHPIRQVVAALERIARGEFASVTNVVNQDELGSLVGHLNRTSQELAELYRVQRETAQQLEEQYESLRRTQAQLIQSEKLRALGEMAGGVAHNFNNLLTVVLAQADLVLKKLDDGEATSKEVRDRLRAIRQAASDGGNMIRRLLDFTRATPRPTDVRAVDINELFNFVLSVAEPRWKDQAHAQGRHIQVITNFRDVPPVMGNVTELREVLVNLVFNALDAMPRGGTLTLSGWADGHAVYLAVTDTGIGMSEEAASRIFEPFFTTKGPQSSGLGLSVSYAIVQRHQGHLNVKSRPGQGTTFTVRLPLREMLVPPPEVTETALPLVGPSRKILVVDDDAPVLQILRDILEDAGYQVWAAQSGPEALELLKRHEIDVVFTDVGMPEMTGWQLVDRIRADWPEMKVVIITGWGASVESHELEARRVDFLIAKPFTTKEIYNVISALALPSTTPLVPGPLAPTHPVSYPRNA